MSIARTIGKSSTLFKSRCLLIRRSIYFMTSSFRSKTSTNYVEPTVKSNDTSLSRRFFRPPSATRCHSPSLIDVLGDTSMYTAGSRTTKDSKITCMCIAAILLVRKRGLHPIHAINNILGPMIYRSHRSMIKLYLPTQQIRHRFPPRLHARSSTKMRRGIAWKGKCTQSSVGLTTF